MSPKLQYLAPLHVAYLLPDLLQKIVRIFGSSKRSPWLNSATAIARINVGFHHLLNKSAHEVSF